MPARGALEQMQAFVADVKAKGGDIYADVFGLDKARLRAEAFYPGMPDGLGEARAEAAEAVAMVLGKPVFR